MIIVCLKLINNYNYPDLEPLVVGTGCLGGEGGGGAFDCDWKDEGSVWLLGCGGGGVGPSISNQLKKNTMNKHKAKKNLCLGLRISVIKNQNCAKKKVVA